MNMELKLPSLYITSKGIPHRIFSDALQQKGFVSLSISLSLSLFNISDDSGS